MKLRVLPEDFIVEEITSLDISREPKAFKVYTLEKRGIESFFILSYLSKRHGIPISKIGIAGLKDKHAITKQYMTIPKEYDFKALCENNFCLTFKGYSDKAIEIGNLVGNKFEITVRDVDKGELPGLAPKIEDIKANGVPNYFDSQRFGSAVDNRFIAKYVIKGDYKEAVKIFLTAYTKSLSKKIKDEKRSILQNWHQLDRVRIENKVFKNVVDTYLKSKDWVSAYKEIPAKMREMYISSYQSYLWNECIKELLAGIIPKNRIFKVEYNVGELLFYKNIERAVIEKLPKKFQTISDKIVPEEHERIIIARVLGSENISLPEFEIKKESKNFFKTHQRDVIIFPADIMMSDPEPDEEGNGNRYKVTLSFQLPKGSFATIVTKRIFNK